MGLSRINRELQFEFCNHMSRMQLPVCQGKENMFIEGGKEVGRVYSKPSIKALHCQVGSLSSFWVPPLSQGVRAPPAGLRILSDWSFCLLIFYRHEVGFGFYRLDDRNSKQASPSKFRYRWLETYQAYNTHSTRLPWSSAPFRNERLFSNNREILSVF